MSLNWKEIKSVLTELDLVGSHIQRITQPDFRNLIIEFYGPGGPLPVQVTLETGETRLHRVYNLVPKPKKRQRFAQLLHARIKGGRVVRAAQVNCDRIVRIDVKRADENTILWIRLWGGAANMIATDLSGTVLDAFFRRPGRGEVSGGHYFIADDPAAVKSRARKLDEFTSRFSSDPEAHGTGPGSVNHQIAEHYRRLAGVSRTRILRERAERLLARRREQLRSRLASLESPGGNTADVATLKLSGDLILANMHRLSGGEVWLEAEDYSHNNETIVIELNPTLNGQENAERYYQRAKKERKRAETWAEEIANVARQLGEIESTLEQVDQWSEDRLEQLLARQERTAAPEKRGPSVAPGLEFSSNGYRILVGRNARENDKLLRHHVRGNDLWLHTRDCPGGYVFIKAQKEKSVPLDVLLDAGNLAVHFSRARNNGRAELYYTFVKYLRRVKDGPRGLVLPTQEKNLSIAVEQSRITRLLV